MTDHTTESERNDTDVPSLPSEPWANDLREMLAGLDDDHDMYSVQDVHDVIHDVEAWYADFEADVVEATIVHHQGVEIVEDFHSIVEMDNSDDVRVFYSDPEDELGEAGEDYVDYQLATVTEVRRVSPDGE